MNGFLQDGDGDKSLTRLLMAIMFVLDWIIIIASVIWQKDIPTNTLGLLNSMNFVFGGFGLAKSGAENLKLFKKEDKNDNINTTII
jgi:hypothetical protein